MEMHQVRYFLAVCEALNFTRAADQCNVAQPSLTRAIKKLEEELGGPLLRRERKRTHLTDLGRLMKPHLETVYAASEAARAEAKGYGKLDTPSLELGVMCTIGPTRLVDFLNCLRRDISSLDVALHENPGHRLVDQLLGGELDVALIGLPEYPDRMDARALFQERYVVAFPKGHRFEDMTAVPMRELDGEDYLSRVNCEYPDHFDSLGVPKHWQVNVRYKSEREDWIQAMILSGMGCTVMAEFLPVLPGIPTRVLVEPEIARTVSLVTVSGRRYSPIVQAFMRLAQRYSWS